MAKCLLGPALASLRRPLLALSTASLLAGVVLFGNAPRALAWNCNAINQQGSEYNAYTGGGWDSSGSPGWPWVSAANITSYNPSPVYTTSSAWTMLVNHNTQYCLSGACFAQVGWIHWNGCQSSFSGSNGWCSDGNEHVFVEYTNNSGSITAYPIYYFNVPSGAERYVAIKTNTGYYQFEWNEGAANSPSSVNFGPAGIEDMEEVGDSGGAKNQGSQWGGDTNTHVQFTNLQWEDQNANLYTVVMPLSQQGTWAAVELPYGSSQINSWFHVWDSRC